MVDLTQIHLIQVLGRKNNSHKTIKPCLRYDTGVDNMMSNTRK